MTSAKLLSRIALLVLFGVLSVAILTGRAVLSGRAAMKQSDDAFNNGDVVTALAFARRAAAHYAPGAPHIRPAYDRLMAIARGAEREGNVELAQRAWASVRSAALETRHVFSPMPDALEAANANLERLARREVAEGGRIADAADKPGAEYRDAERPGVGAPYWGAVLFLGFGLMALGLLYSIVRGIRPDGKFSPSDLRWGALLMGVGATCWTVVVLWA